MGIIQVTPSSSWQCISSYPSSYSSLNLAHRRDTRLIMGSRVSQKHHWGKEGFIDRTKTKTNTKINASARVSVQAQDDASSSAGGRSGDFECLEVVCKLVHRRDIESAHTPMVATHLSVLQVHEAQCLSCALQGGIELHRSHEAASGAIAVISHELVPVPQPFECLQVPCRV